MYFWLYADHNVSIFPPFCAQGIQGSETDREASLQAGPNEGDARVLQVRLGPLRRASGLQSLAQSKDLLAKLQLDLNLTSWALYAF